MAGEANSITFTPSREDHRALVEVARADAHPVATWLLGRGLLAAAAMLSLPFLLGTRWSVSFIGALLAVGLATWGSSLAAGRAAIRSHLRGGPLPWTVHWDNSGLDVEHLGGTRRVPWDTVVAIKGRHGTLVVLTKEPRNSIPVPHEEAPRVLDVWVALARGDAPPEVGSSPDDAHADTDE